MFFDCARRSANRRRHPISVVFPGFEPSPSFLVHGTGSALVGVEGSAWHGGFFLQERSASWESISLPSLAARPRGLGPERSWRRCFWPPPPCKPSTRRENENDRPISTRRPNTIHSTNC